MRRHIMLFLGLAVLGAAPAVNAYAQARQDEEDQRRQAEADADAKKKEKDKEWNTSPAPLPEIKNAGPCPFAKALYDASRYIELKDGKETAEAVGYTGEIEGVRANCAYRGGEPIRVQMNVGFGFGRGPQAQGST